jgi:hypothetical protein
MIGIPPATTGTVGTIRPAVTARPTETTDGTCRTSTC